MDKGLISYVQMYGGVLKGGGNDILDVQRTLINSNRRSQTSNPLAGRVETTCLVHQPLIKAFWSTWPSKIVVLNTPPLLLSSYCFWSIRHGPPLSKGQMEL